MYIPGWEYLQFSCARTEQWHDPLRPKPDSTPVNLSRGRAHPSILSVSWGCRRRPGRRIAAHLVCPRFPRRSLPSYGRGHSNGGLVWSLLITFQLQLIGDSARIGRVMVSC